MTRSPNVSGGSVEGLLLLQDGMDMSRLAVNLHFSVVPAQGPLRIFMKVESTLPTTSCTK